MVLAIASSLLAKRITSNWLLRILVPFGAYTLTKSWAGGYRCVGERRNITDKVFVLVGALSGPGLALLRSLAERGALVIVLHPTPSDPAVLELILLLRYTTNNERIYADECDITSLKSIKAFVKRWGTDARKGMVGDLEALIEGLIFCDGDGSGLEGVGIGVPKQTISEVGTTMELHHSTLLLGRHCLIQLLLPFLVRSSQAAPVRIIFQISPFYAASPPLLPSPSDALEFVPPAHYPRIAPWVAEGQASLASLALLRELQARVDEARKPDAPGIVCLGACGGFTRAWFRRMFRATRSHPHFSWWGLLAYLLLWPVLFMLTKNAEQASQDLLLAVVGNVTTELPSGKDPSKGSSSEEEPSRTARLDDEDKRPRKLLRRGQLLREGEAIHVGLLDEAGPTLGPKLWETESKKVEDLMALVVIEEGKESAAAKAAETHANAGPS